MNKVILLGRLTKDPETRSTQSGMLVSTFSLAVNRRFSKEKEADFINCVAWGKTAEFCKNYCTKGRQFAVSGRIQTRTWDDNDGKKHYVTEVVVEDIYFADSRKDDNGGARAYSPSGGDSIANMIPPMTNSGEDNGFYPADEDADDLPF